MSVRSLGAVASTRRSPAGPSTTTSAAALAPGGSPTQHTDGLTSLEQAVPTEIIAFYTAVLAACQTVVARTATATFLPFRVAIYVVGLAAVCYVGLRSIAPAVQAARRRTEPGDGAVTQGVTQAVLASPEWWTSTLSFAAWGLAVPGSFLYVWLSPDALTISVASITAGAALVIGVGLGPRLKAKDPSAGQPEAGPVITPNPAPAAPGA